ncbi:RsmB/NOP family class I SAM-dependent RNA methyltransferase [Dyadobacter sandarakinus]|uniref:RsmB/NOP family class I SAM-dependent RNA methyltransferase n=1 Tax=Dyadobacter sandarakinus TaxID=2747268 RepID=A0ABX7IEB3_9BACT|nr:RsmB/NOP family class I SAM-dependent RNA methyltransferase [Dyadobacter sandarakinus]
MKLHRGLVAAVADALQSIFVQNRQADRVVEQLLKSNKKWGARDRAFLAEHVYDIVRWWRLIKYVSEKEHVSDQPGFWEIVGAWLIIKPLHLQNAEANQLPDWSEWMYLRQDVVLARYQDALAIRKIAGSVPDWLDEVCSRELGDAWDDELAALNRPALPVLRANTLKTTRDQLADLLGHEQVELLPGLPDALVLKKRQNVQQLESYQQGLFEVQDAGSQLIAPYLDIQPGMSVIDACAGAGGKTLHIGALLRQTGSVLSMDVEPFKLAELTKRAARSGMTNVETIVIQGLDSIKNLAGTADRLLLDVPCSGLGVLRRNPDSKWKLKPAFLDQIRKIQWDILSNYAAMVKKGGKMVYATCSILPSESEEQVQRFLKSFPDEWTLISEQRTSPARDGFDGFYMALMQRK